MKNGLGYGYMFIMIDKKLSELVQRNWAHKIRQNFGRKWIVKWIVKWNGLTWFGMIFLIFIVSL